MQICGKDTSKITHMSDKKSQRSNSSVNYRKCLLKKKMAHEPRSYLTFKGYKKSTQYTICSQTPPGSEVVFPVLTCLQVYKALFIKICIASISKILQKSLFLETLSHSTSLDLRIKIWMLQYKR